MAKTTHQQLTKPSGFTLLELLITIVVAGILLSIAVPNLQGFIQNSRQTAAINGFNGMVSYARSEAISRNTNISLCIANANNTACAGDGSDWSNGYLVLVDNTGAVLKIHEALPGNQTMIASGFSNTNRIVFANNGMLSSTGSFQFCDPRGNSAMRGLILNSGGQIRLSPDFNSNGTPDTAASTPATPADLGNCPS